MTSTRELCYGSIPKAGFAQRPQGESRGMQLGLGLPPDVSTLKSPAGIPCLKCPVIFNCPGYLLVLSLIT